MANKITDDLINLTIDRIQQQIDLTTQLMTNDQQMTLLLVLMETSFRSAVEFTLEFYQKDTGNPPPSRERVMQLLTLHLLEKNGMDLKQQRRES